MDLATLIGIVGGVIVMGVGIATAGGLGSIPSYIDVPSFIVTLGGAFIAVLGAHSLDEYIGGLTAIGLAIKMPATGMGEIITQIVGLSNTARKEGLLALEEAANNLEDAFMKKGLLLIADGTEPELVKSILEAEIDAIDGRHKGKIAVWEDIAGQGPSWGMIGTLIGLVNMLNNMEDASTIGPSMAVALLTTMYGAILANWLCFPVSATLKVRNGDELMLKSVIVEGLLSIQAGENPRVTEEKLKAFMSPKDRADFEASAGGGGGGGE